MARLQRLACRVADESSTRIGSRPGGVAITNEGVEWIRKAMRLNPHHPARFWSHLGKAYFVGRQYAQAIECFMRLSTMDAQQHAFVAASYGLLGDQTAAAAHVARVRQLDPGLDLQTLLATMHYTREADLAHLRDGLTRAGL